MSTITTTTVQRIKTLADELDQLGRAGLPKAIEAGKLLKQCKAGLAHGQWMPWLEENFKLSHKTAMNWMMIHDADEAGKLETVTNLTDAYRIASKGLKSPAPPAQRAPAPRPSPAAVVIEAEIVEPEAQDIEEEMETLVVDGTDGNSKTPQRPPNYIPTEGILIWGMAKSQLVRIAKNDTQRVEALKKCIDYCHSRLTKKEIEPLVVDGVKPAPAPKEDDEVITIRVSDLKKIIADIDEGFDLIRFQEGPIEEAIEAGKISFTGNGEDILESYTLAAGKAQSKIGSAIDRLEWNVPQKLLGPLTSKPTP